MAAVRPVDTGGAVRKGSAPDRETNPDVRIRQRGPLAALCFQVAAIVRLEIRTELRGLPILSAMASLGLLTVLVLGFVFEAAGAADGTRASGVLWAALLLAGAAGLERQFGSADARAMTGFLLSAPVSRTALFLGRLWVWSLLLAVAGVLALIGVIVLFDAALWKPGILGVLFLGCIGFAALGTTVVAMMSGMRQGQGLVAVIVLPLAIPLLLAGTGACNALTQEASGQTYGAWILMVILFDLVAVAVGILLANLVWQDWR
ncbi:MAG: heme exporter protein CcmB [Caldilineaceae bacterium]|nr:heme exporter protein CcmB [Caldilineaceae bacterium]